MHLTATGRAEFALFLRESLLDLLGDGTPRPRPLVPGVPLRVPVLGQFGVPATGVAGVAMNVTAVDPGGPGWLRVWPCGSAEPTTSSVNYVARGVVEPNAVVVPVDATGEVCISTMTATDVLVDVSGWFETGLRAGAGRLVDTRDDGATRTVTPATPLRVPVLDRFGVPPRGGRRLAERHRGRPGGSGLAAGVAVRFAGAGDLVGELRVPRRGRAERGRRPRRRDR